MIRQVLISTALVALCAFAGDANGPAGMRNLAKRMLQSKNAGADSAFCDFVLKTQGEECSGLGNTSLRHRIGRNGKIETWHYRGWRESGDPIGYYRGQVSEKQWRDLLRTVVAMREGPLPSGMPMLLPPEPTIPVPVLILSDGKDTVEFRNAGPSPESISEAFAQPGLFARGERDTVWQLGLVNPKVNVQKDSLHFTAKWQWRGRMGTRVLYSREAGGRVCGTARFKWFLDTSDFSVEWHEAAVHADKGRGQSWELSSEKSSMLRLTFPYDGPGGKAKRTGILEGIGIRLIPADARDTISATVTTERFEF